VRKIFILLFAVLVSCNQTSNDDVLSEASTEVETTQTTVATQDETTTTLVEVSQLDPFRDRTYTIIKEESRASYLAPKQFLNSGLETVEGITREIEGSFDVSLDSCDSSDSCITISNLYIKVDISALKSSSATRDRAISTQWLESALFPNAIFTIDEETIPNKNFDSKIEDVFVGKLTIREIELNTPFSITAYIQDEKLFVTGFTEIDTTWFGFDAPTKFNAWEVLNPIGISVSLVAEEK
jgi:hypothetical protein